MYFYEPPTKLSLTSVEGSCLLTVSFNIFFICFTEFQEAFQLFDNRGDGKIHVSQIGDALRALGQNPTESDVKKFTHQHKPDERVSFEVFLPIYQVRKNFYLFPVEWLCDDSPTPGELYESGGHLHSFA